MTGQSYLWRRSSDSAISIQNFSDKAAVLLKGLPLNLRISDECGNGEYQRRISTSGMDLVDWRCVWEKQIRLFEQLPESLIRGQ